MLFAVQRALLWFVRLEVSQVLRSSEAFTMPIHTDGDMDLLEKKVGLITGAAQGLGPSSPGRASCVTAAFW
jgi:hypothetical protein